MITPDTVPTITADEVIPYLKEKKDFFYSDANLSGLNSEYAYVFRHKDVAICIWCVHGHMYVREEPRIEWPAGVMLAVMMAYSFSGVIPTGDQVPCDDSRFFIACIAHGVQDDTAANIPPEILALADEIMRKPGE